MNNFSDLKSSNDYLHIIRLRYDNRWLRTYWDGKLKEVEKDFNFYVSTPIKNKVFLDTNIGQRKTALMGADLKIVKTSPSLTKSDVKNLDFHNAFERKLKKGVAEGAYKKELPVNVLSNFYSNESLEQNLDDLFVNYGSSKNYYTKNSKNNVKSVDDLKEPLNLWGLSRNNSISKIFPNSNSVLLSGNLLISTKEGEGAFNTNLVSIKDPS